MIIKDQNIGYPLIDATHWVFLTYMITEAHRCPSADEKRLASRIFNLACAVRSIFSFTAIILHGGTQFRGGSRALSLYNAILIHHKSLSGRIRCRFAAGSARVFWAARDALVFHPNVPRHNPADDQGKDSE